MLSHPGKYFHYTTQPLQQITATVTTPRHYTENLWWGQAGQGWIEIFWVWRMVQQENIFSQLHYIEWWRGAEMVDLQIGERIVSAGHCDTQPHWENPQRHVHQQPTTTLREILDSELCWRQLLTLDRHLLDHVPNHGQLDKVGWCGLGCYADTQPRPAVARKTIEARRME